MILICRVPMNLRVLRSPMLIELLGIISAWHGLLITVQPSTSSSPAAAPSPTSPASALIKVTIALLRVRMIGRLRLVVPPFGLTFLLVVAEVLRLVCTWLFVVNVRRVTASPAYPNYVVCIDELCVVHEAENGNIRMALE